MAGKRLVLTVGVMLALFGAASLFADGGGCTGASVSSCGSIILDNTPNPGQPMLVTNMATNIGGKNFGGSNSFSIGGIQVMQRKGDTQSDITTLVDEVGVSNPASTSYSNYGQSTQLNYFASGQHLFDLDRFRTAADWLASNVASNAGSHPTGSYGTISWTEFLQNIANNQTMYGMVRIKVPLKLSGTTGRNATDVNNECATDATKCTQLYGFCGTATDYLCASAPGSGTEIKPNGTVNGIPIPNNAQIKVRGALMFDFVDNVSGNPIPLTSLPWNPRELYFKIILPINVNAANDSNGDGVVDNINYIDSLTSTEVCGMPPCEITITTNINYNQVPQESKDAFRHQYGVTLDQATFDNLSKPNQYHLLMPSGYAQGWHDAFQELGVTAAQWKALGFGAPDAIATDDILSVEEIRSESFEDIPVYLYTGGLVDMHDHVNISGFVYVPQALELEQKRGSVRQYIMGAVIVRDGFFLEATPGGVTLLSNDPMSYSNIRVRPPTTGAVVAGLSEPGTSTNTNTSNDEPIVGNPVSNTLPGGGGGGGGGGGVPPPAPPGPGGLSGSRIWAEIRPR